MNSELEKYRVTKELIADAVFSNLRRQGLSWEQTFLATHGYANTFRDGIARDIRPNFKTPVENFDLLDIPGGGYFVAELRSVRFSDDESKYEVYLIQ